MLSRRLLFVLPIFACKKSQIKEPVSPSNPILPPSLADSPKEESKENVDPDKLPTLGSFGGGLKEIKLDSSKKKVECESSSKVDLENIPLAPERYTIQHHAYGDAHSLLFAFKLPKYEHGDLRNVFLCHEDGRLIAMKPIISRSDVENRALRIQVFEHLILNPKLPYVLLMQEGRGFYKIELGLMQFKTVFRNKPIATQNQSEHIELYGINKPSPLIHVDLLSSFSKDFIDDSSYFAFTGSIFLRDCVVCDPVGAVLSEVGESFQDFTNHPFIVCYKEMDEFYLQTFIRLS